MAEDFDREELNHRTDAVRREREFVQVLADQAREAIMDTEAARSSVPVLLAPPSGWCAPPTIQYAAPYEGDIDLTSDLAAAIAAEEHRQGLPVTPDRDHCQDCLDQFTAHRQLCCDHEESYELRKMSGWRMELCADCGAQL